jgi:hypothetical protein
MTTEDEGERCDEDDIVVLLHDNAASAVGKRVSEPLEFSG